MPVSGTTGRTALHRRHRLGLGLSAGGAVLLAGLLVFANPLPSLGAQPDAALPIAGVPLLVLVYPIYIVVCIGLALDALLRPGPTGRMLGDRARRRAQPWLATASAMLLLVCGLVAGTMLWVVRQLGADAGARVVIDAALAVRIAWADLAIAALIALATVMLGQALVAYEVFTGKSLPRRGLLRFWRNALALAGGYGLVAGAGLTLHLRPIYLVLLSTGLLSGFYALFSWRAYAERERYIGQLRPFVDEPGAVRAPAGTGAIDRGGSGQRRRPRNGRGGRIVPRAVPRRTRCAAGRAGGAGTLGRAGGRAAALRGRGPAGTGAQRAHPGGHCRPNPARSRGPAVGGATGTRPNRAARSGRCHCVAGRPQPGELRGLLVLGEKTSGLYTQEEIDIARAGGERLLDSLASAELARRLVALQRQRLAESQVLDRRTRRVLHDDVLPQLHAALLHLNAAESGSEPASEAAHLLAGAHRQLSTLLRELPAGREPAVAGLGLLDALRRLASGEFARAFDAIEWAVRPRAPRRPPSACRHWRPKCCFMRRARPCATPPGTAAAAARPAR